MCFRVGIALYAHVLQYKISYLSCAPLCVYGVELTYLIEIIEHIFQNVDIDFDGCTRDTAV